MLVLVLVLAATVAAGVATIVVLHLAAILLGGVLATVSGIATRWVLAVFRSRIAEAFREETA